jgi:ubiquinone biosynthesis protein
MAVEKFRKTAATRPTLKRRRDEVVARLAAHGLTRGPHRVARAAGVEGPRSRRLRAALEGLGPVFSAFGLYLATRVDLLSAGDCLELAAIPDRATPATPAATRDVFSRGIGYVPEEAFAAFEAQPFESRLLSQSHRARLPNGTPVVVKVVRPEVEQGFLYDVELLHLLEGALDGVAHGGESFRSAAADFVAALGQQMDLTHEAQALETLARDAEAFELLRVPEVQRGLCAPHVLTVEELTGGRLDAPESPAAGPGARRGLPNGLDRTGLARLLCSVWLRQALLGHVFPVEPGPANIVFLSGRRVAFTGGLFASLPAEPQSNIWNYLIATAAENPDHACSCLLREVRRAGPAGGDEDLRHRFRQVVPFRDSEWHRDEDQINHLIEHLVVHWRSADACGYVPQPHMPPFYRGLFAIMGSAQQLAPESDPLFEGLQDVRLLASIEQARKMMSLDQLGDQMDKYAAMMMGLPQRLDEMLTLASEGGARVRLHVPETTAHRRRKNYSAVVASLLLVLAAVAFVLPRVTASLFAEEWANRVNAVVFIACGALLLRAAGRAG